MKARVRIRTALILVLWVPAALAHDPPKIAIAVSGDRYSMNMHFVLKAPVKRVWEVLTNYAKIKRLNPNVRESRVIYHGKQMLLRLRIRSCVLFICFPITQTESMTLHAPLEVSGVIIPALSSFRSGSSRWRLHPVIGGTWVDFKALLVPSFYIPPILGSWIIQQKLHSEMRETARRLRAWVYAKRPYKA